jgi:hypothetical protein
MAEEEIIIAAGLVTKRDLALLGPHFHRLYPVLPDAGFADLLLAIDRVDDRR